MFGFIFFYNIIYIYLIKYIFNNFDFYKIYFNLNQNKLKINKNNFNNFKCIYILIFNDFNKLNLNNILLIYIYKKNYFNFYILLFYIYKKLIFFIVINNNNSLVFFSNFSNFYLNKNLKKNFIFVYFNNNFNNNYKNEFFLLLNKFNNFRLKYIFLNFLKKKYLNYNIKFCVVDFFKNINYNVLNYLNVLFLRKVKIFNKGRYSRNRQYYRTGVYWCLYINIIAVIGIYFWFYRFNMNFGYMWWLFFFFIGSFIFSKCLKFNFFNIIKLIKQIYNSMYWFLFIVYTIFIYFINLLINVFNKIKYFI